MYKHMGNYEIRSIREELNRFKKIKELIRNKDLFQGVDKKINIFIKNSEVKLKDIKVEREIYNLVEDFLFISQYYNLKKIYSNMGHRIDEIYYANVFIKNYPFLEDLNISRGYFDIDDIDMDGLFDLDGIKVEYLVADSLRVISYEDRDNIFTIDEDEIKKIESLLPKSAYDNIFEYINSEYYDDEYETIEIINIKSNFDLNKIEEYYGSESKYYELLKGNVDDLICEQSGDYYAESCMANDNSIIISTNNIEFLSNISFRLNFLRLYSIVTGKDVMKEGTSIYV